MSQLAEGKNQTGDDEKNLKDSTIEDEQLYLDARENSTETVTGQDDSV